MATQLQIVNLALQRLGCERIGALSDNNKRAKLMNDLYENTKCNTLSDYRWSFSIKEVTLTSADLTAASPFNYTYEYDLPEDHVRILDEFDELVYEIFGKRVQSDETELRFSYISSSDMEIDYPPDFVKVFYLSLAVDSCISLTQDKTMLGQVQAELDKVLENTRFNNSKESTIEEFEIDSYLDVRL